MSGNKNRIVIENLGSDRRYVGKNDAGDYLLIDRHDGTDGPSVGMRPMEALLVSLGTCSALDVAAILEKRRTPVRTYRLEIEGKRAETFPQRYTKIKVRHMVGGEGIEDAQLQRAVKLSHDKYCSVHASLNAEIEYEAVLEDVEE